MMMDGTKLEEGDTVTADVTAKGQASYIIPGPAPSEKKASKEAESSDGSNGTAYRPHNKMSIRRRLNRPLTAFRRTSSNAAAWRLRSSYRA